MELLNNLILGFGVAFTPENLFYALLGCLLGTLVGVLPGLGPVPTIAMLLPITYVLPPIAGLIMLAGIYYGAQYGGSTTAILVNLPGETSSVVTCLDGHAMAKNGRAGSALAIAALASFFAGSVATLLLAAFAPPLAEVAFKFGPAEYFSLMVLGLVGAAVLSSFASYTLEKKISKHPERFGKGHPAGVAGPEAANNAGAQTSFIPLLTLGIPGNAVMALMVGAMTIHNIQPGPQVMSSHPQLFWGLIASMWIGNLMLVVLNLPLIGIWVKLLKVPYRILFPAILVFCTIGVYSLNYNTFDIFTTACFGMVGYVWSKLKCEGAPLLLGLVLGPLMEENFRRALLLSRGSYMTFLERGLSASLLGVALFLVIIVALPSIRKKREEAFVEEE